MNNSSVQREARAVEGSRVGKASSHSRLQLNRHPLQATVCATVLSVLVCGCSSSASDTPPASDAGNTGTSSSSPPVGDGQAFVPNTVPFKSVDEDLSMQYKLLSATVREYADFTALLVSVRNDSGALLCDPTLNALFKTATTKSGQAVVPLSSSMYLASFGSAEPCLEPGAVGFGASTVSFGAGVALSDVTSILYEPQGTLDPASPTKITNVELSELAVTTLPGGGEAIGGTLANHGTKALGNIVVSYLALDSGGRPYDFDSAWSDTPIAAGSTWAFTLRNISSLGKHVASAQFVLEQP